AARPRRSDDSARAPSLLLSATTPARRGPPGKAPAPRGTPPLGLPSPGQAEVGGGPYPPDADDETTGHVLRLASLAWGTSRTERASCSTGLIEPLAISTRTRHLYRQAFCGKRTRCLVSPV